MWSFIRPDSIRVFQDETIQERMSRYIAIRNGNRIAKYLIAKKVPVNSPIDLSVPDKNLWKTHEKAREVFLDFQNIADTKKNIPKENASPSFLDLKVALMNRILKECSCCERRCGVDRTKGEIGVCGVENSRLSTAFLHQGEEAPLVPSGTIFFSGCTFKCVFCQNWDISTNPNSGSPIDAKKLAKTSEKLFQKGAVNINYVGGDPTPHAGVIIESLLYQTHNVAQLWNSNMYLSSELLEILLDLMDIWLPDLKYGPSDCAKVLSKIPNYWEFVTRNIKRAHNFDVTKRKSTMIIRHLVMPNHVYCCTKPILEWISENSPDAFVNIMAQYRPQHKVLQQEKYGQIARSVSKTEMILATSIAESLGIAWRQVS
ncbi:MAG: radical SAM protein [Candidatus Ranarchaeia archaeon]|jgi:putative pyruvate formate lyase activating enzyme